MSYQDFKSHGRYIPLYHIITTILIVFIFVGSIIGFIHGGHDNFHSSILFLLTALVLSSLLWYARIFALRAQDRAIRAEENFRHYIITGKPLDNRLRISQIIALRFASDEEFVNLAKRAADENMSSKEIKMAIKNWKADFHRV